MKKNLDFKKTRFAKLFIFASLLLGSFLPTSLSIVTQTQKMNEFSSNSQNDENSMKNSDIAIRTIDSIEIDQKDFNKNITLNDVYVDTGGAPSLEDVQMKIEIKLYSEGVSIEMVDDDYRSSFLMMIPNEVTSQEEILRFMAKGVNYNDLNYYYPNGDDNWFALLPGQDFKMILIPNGGKIIEPIIFNFKLTDNLANEYKSCIYSDTDKRDIFWKQKHDHYNILYKKYHLKKDNLFSDELNSKNFATQSYNSKMFYGSYFQKTINGKPLYFFQGNNEEASQGFKNIITNTKIINTVDKNTLFKTPKLDYSNTNMFFMRGSDLVNLLTQVENYVKLTYGEIIPDSWTWETQTLWDVLMFQANGGEPDDLISAVQGASNEEIKVKMKNDPIPIIANAYQEVGFDNDSAMMAFNVRSDSGKSQISSFYEWDSIGTRLSLRSSKWALPNETSTLNQSYFGVEYDLYFHHTYYHDTENKVNAQLSQNLSNELFDENDLNNYLQNISYTFLNQGRRRNDNQNITSLLSIPMTVNGKTKEHFIAVSEIVLIVFVVLMLLFLIGIILLFVYRNKKETESISINPNYKEEANEIKVDS